MSGILDRLASFPPSRSAVILRQPDGSYAFSLTNEEVTDAQLIESFQALLASGPLAAELAAIRGLVALRLVAGSNLSDLTDPRAARHAIGIEALVSVEDEDHVIAPETAVINIVDIFTAQRTWTLPPAASVNAGHKFTVYDDVGSVNAAHPLRVVPAGTDTLNGDFGVLIPVPHFNADFYSDGVSRWSLNTTFLNPPGVLTGYTPVADKDYQATPKDVFVAYTALTAKRNLLLPAANLYTPGQPLCVADESGNCSSANSITVKPGSGDAIVGVSSPGAIMASPGQKLTLHSNGTNKWTVA